MRTKGNVCIDSLGQKVGLRGIDMAMVTAVPLRWLPRVSDTPSARQSGSALGLYACHGLGGNQEWTLTKGHELRHKVCH